MTTQELISALASQLDFTQQQVAKIVDATATLLNTKLENNHSVEIEGLGFFKTVKQVEYIALNPALAKRVLMPPRISLTFSTEKINLDNSNSEDTANQTFNLNNLIDLLTTNIKIQETEAEDFLLALIATIKETVEKDELVEIKNWGTFKLSKEIPNVSTMTFVPEKGLEDAINKPFAHFESVELEDEVSFDMEEPTDIEKDTKINQTIQERISSILSKTTIENKPNDLSIEKQDPNIEVPVGIVIEEVKEIEEQEVTPIEPYIEVMEDLQQVKEEQQVPAAVEIIEEVLEIPSIGLDYNTEPISETNTLDIEARSIESENIKKSTYAQHSTHEKERGRKRRPFILISMVLIILSCLLWYFSNTLISKEQEAFDKDNKNLIIYDEEISADSSTMKTAAVEYQEQIIEPNKAAKTQAKAEASPTTKTELIVADTKVQTTTTKQGDTMRSLGLRYYGNKSFWVYIYQENKAIITDPNNIPLGTQLTIAPRTKYGIDANNPESLKKARNIEAKIFADMK